MTKFNKNVMTAGLLFAGITLSAQATAQQQWPQSEQAYAPATQSPQWVDSKRNAMPPQNMPNPNMMQQQAPYQAPRPSFGYQPQPNMAPGMAPNMVPNPQPYAQPGFAQPYPPQGQYRGNNGWGNWPNFNNGGFMPGMPNMNMGNWSTPNMNMGNWSMPDMSNMPGLSNMDGFEMPSPSFNMPSPSFTTPNMNMPFNNRW